MSTSSREDRAANGDLRAYTMLEWIRIYLTMLPALAIAGAMIALVSSLASVATMMLLVAAAVVPGAALRAPAAEPTSASPKEDPTATKTRSCDLWCTKDATAADDHGFFDGSTCTCVRDGKVTTTIGPM
ncbi:MAG: hypothetical protein ABMB14_11925 [Myxococcota bacterium]